jgi:hypothetical protein
MSGRKNIGVVRKKWRYSSFELSSKQMALSMYIKDIRVVDGNGR